MSAKTKSRVKSRTATPISGNGSVPEIVPNETKEVLLSVPAPNFQVLDIPIVGTSPYCQSAFGGRPVEEMKESQLAGSTGKSRKKREPKDFEQRYRDCTHRSAAGWAGIPASSFRTAMISACRVCGVVMTRAKLAVFIIQDGFDVNSGDPLVRISPEPEMKISPLRNDNGSMDLRARPYWEPGWKAVVRIKFDADVMRAVDVVNLMFRVGQQVGIGEGRHDSKKCCGIGWGCFKLEESFYANFRK